MALLTQNTFMPTPGTIALAMGAALSAFAALAHIACVVVGPAAYRFMGAGEKMARAVQAGKLQPTLVTLAIAAILFTWAAYALSGAGLISRLPLTKLALLVITAVYLVPDRIVRNAIQINGLRVKFGVEELWLSESSRLPGHVSC